mmetsp:Transcript_149458/g.212507  ORF Transcript_149458/g.212507 Transcript_149458/m.212507 type:complete len:225 (+) Transcript_149458:539-1213(+)
MRAAMFAFLLAMMRSIFSTLPSSCTMRMARSFSSRAAIRSSKLALARGASFSSTSSGCEVVSFSIFFFAFLDIRRLMTLATLASSPSNLIMRIWWSFCWLVMMGAVVTASEAGVEDSSGADCFSCVAAVALAVALALALALRCLRSNAARRLSSTFSVRSVLPWNLCMSFALSASSSKVCFCFATPLRCSVCALRRSTAALLAVVLVVFSVVLVVVVMLVVFMI